jgi:hypothetical protein
LASPDIAAVSTRETGAEGSSDARHLFWIKDSDGLSRSDTATASCPKEQDMPKLFPLIFSIAGVTCAGIAMVIALTLGQDTLQPILTWVAAGTLVGLLASWIIARKLAEI